MISSTFFLRQAIKSLYRLPLFEMARRSPRFIGLIPMRPMRAVISLTYKCNSRCITCYHWNEEPRDELTFTQLSDVLCQLKSIGVVDLCLTGGEPLLRDDLPDIVRKASELKFDRIHIITNGLLLTRPRIEQLVESGLTSVYISLNGSEDLHDMTRGMKGAYPRTMKALKTLVELRASRFPQLEINVLTIVMGLNLDRIIDMANMCRQWGIRLSLSPLNTANPWQQPIPAGLRSINQAQLDGVIEELHLIKRKSPSLLHHSHAALEFFRKYFADHKRDDIPCYLGYLEIYLGPYGEVSPGCWALPPVGNITQASLEHIMDSKAYKERASDMFLKRCPGCACDHVFNLYAHSPFLVEEIKWRLRLPRGDYPPR